MPLGEGGYTFNMSAKSIPVGGGGPTASAPWDRVALVQHGIDMWGKRTTQRVPTIPSVHRLVSSTVSTALIQRTRCLVIKTHVSSLHLVYTRIVCPVYLHDANDE